MSLAPSAKDDVMVNIDETNPMLNELNAILLLLFRVIKFWSNGWFESSFIQFVSKMRKECEENIV